MSTMQVLRLGRVEYEDGLILMKRFGEARLQGLVPDTLLLLEHPPVLTLGRAGKRENIVASDALLAAEGVAIHETNRGGDVTYHGPGQIVGYPVFLLGPGKQDVRGYVRDVEDSLLRVLAKHGIRAGVIPKWRGVWVGEETDPDARKIAAIGVHISRWLTTHGFALNVNTRLEHFSWIVPCGISEAGVTSMQKELGRALSIDTVEAELAESFATTFGHALERVEVHTKTVAVAVLRRSPRGPEVLLLRRTAERGGFWQIVTGRLQPGESALEAARRELSEETGRTLPIVDLGYRHAFSFGEALPPRVFEESGFAAVWEPAGDPKLSPEEHDAFEWVPVQEALTKLPFAGLKETVRRALTLLR